MAAHDAVAPAQWLGSGWRGGVPRSGLSPLDCRFPATGCACIFLALQVIGLSQLRDLAGAEVAASLKALADDQSFALRGERYERYPDAVVASLHGLDDARAWQLRERFLSVRGRKLAGDQELASVLRRSVCGLEDARASRNDEDREARSAQSSG
jgi:hypothetical protein